MINKINVTILMFILGLLKISAQYSETIDSGRPGQAIGADTAGKNVFQIEAGMDYSSKVFVPNSFFRYAISDRFEVNSGFGYNISDKNISAFSVGTRINLYKSDDFPIGVQISYNIPIENLPSSTSVVFATSKSFTDKLDLGLNLGTTISKNTNVLYVVNLSYSVNDKIGIFIEPYGTISNNFELNFDTGISYLLNKNLKLDFLTGYGLNNENGLLLSLGVSWRTK